MKNKKLIIGISAAAAVLVVGGGIWFALGRDGSGNDENVVYVTTVESLTSQGNMAGESFCGRGGNAGKAGDPAESGKDGKRNLCGRRTGSRGGYSSIFL